MHSLASSLIINQILLSQHNTLNLNTSKKENAAKVALQQHKTLMHGVKFNQPVKDIATYLVSEKLDGIRAYWDGKYLWSRQGLIIKAPHSLTSELPSVPLDGELWLGRGSFEAMMGLVQANDPHDPKWSQVSFAIFDLPSLTGSFQERYTALSHLVPVPIEASLIYPIFAIPQKGFKDQNELFEYFQQVLNQGGEGLILHKKTNPYQFQRTNNILKLKPEHVSQVTVIGYKAGKGKYQDMLGSLEVENTAGKRFYVGSGLTDALRSNPPALNSKICILHTGFTTHGIPRFPRYTELCQAQTLSK